MQNGTSDPETGPEIGPETGTGADFYAGWARYYDAIHADRGPHLAFYTGLIGPDTGALLDLGCGSGTITMALADLMADRARVTGIDLSDGMIAIARARDPVIDWRVGDIRHPPVQGRFDLITCCFHTMQVLLTDDAMAEALAGVHARLAGNGRFAFDIYRPNPAYLAALEKGRIVRRFHDSDGRALQIEEDAAYDPATQVLTGLWHLCDGVTGERLPLPPMEQTARQYFPADIERLLAEAGLTIETRYGDLDRSAYGPSAKRQVIICRRAG